MTTLAKGLIIFFILLSPAVWAEGGKQMHVYSPAFENGAAIPRAYAYCGSGARNLSPPLAWSGAPPNTRSYVLLVHDPDAPVGDFVHWVVYDLPASVAELPEGASGKGGFLEGVNDYGFKGYGGPCPPPGPAHRYFFELYALSVPSLALPAGAKAVEVLQVMKPYLLARAELVGIYKR